MAEMERIDAPATAARQAARLTEALESLPGVTAVRGLGLLMAVELDRESKGVAGWLLDNGLVVNAVTATALRLAPPITVSDAEIHEAVELIRQSLQ